MPGGLEQARRIGCDRAVGHEPIGATVERVARVMVAHLRRKSRDVGACHVGRVGDDEIERPVKGCAIVGREKCRATVKAHLPSIRARNVERIRIDIGADALRVRQLGEKRQ